MTLPGYATLEGATTYQQRFSSTLAPAHFRESLGLRLSSIGLGAYPEEVDDATDAQYAGAIGCALAHGCNVLDTAINYRHQRSERVIGRVLSALDAKGVVKRAEVLIQGKLAQQQPPFIREALTGLTTDAQRAIQFARSTPGITTALVGMKSAVHVEQNMAVAAISPASMSQFQKLFHDRRSGESA